jgi:DNA repair protein RecN (Recombination protein N)
MELIPDLRAMLRKLHVQNYLLIDQLELDLGAGLTVITGETGSGKSILIGALGLLARRSGRRATCCAMPRSAA